MPVASAVPWFTAYALQGVANEIIRIVHPPTDNVVALPARR